jgi:hypothetical protein
METGVRLSGGGLDFVLAEIDRPQLALQDVVRQRSLATIRGDENEG